VLRRISIGLPGGGATWVAPPLRFWRDLPPQTPVRPGVEGQGDVDGLVLDQALRPGFSHPAGAKSVIGLGLSVSAEALEADKKVYLQKLRA